MTTTLVSYIVTADHVSPDYRLERVVFGWDDFAEGHGRLSGETDATPPRVRAYLPRFGQGHDYSNPLLAIRDLLAANGCTNIQIEPNGEASPSPSPSPSIHRQIDLLKGDHEFRAAGALARRNGLPRSYGAHYGMRSTRESAIAEFYAGWDSVESFVAAPSPSIPDTAASIAPRLPFAFELLAATWFAGPMISRERGAAIVLVRRLSAGDFVTFAMDSNGDCHWGHYDMTASEGATDYAERVANYSRRMTANLA